MTTLLTIIKILKLVMIITRSSHTNDFMSAITARCKNDGYSLRKHIFRIKNQKNLAQSTTKQPLESNATWLFLQFQSQIRLETRRGKKSCKSYEELRYSICDCSFFQKKAGKNRKVSFGMLTRIVKTKILHNIDSGGDNNHFVLLLISNRFVRSYGFFRFCFSPHNV